MILIRSFLNTSLGLNLFSVGAASALSKLLNLLIIGYPARILGPENYGLVGFGASLVAYSGIMILPGLTTWGTREIARNRDNTSVTLVTVILIRVVLAVFSYLLLFLFVFSVIDDPKERTVVLLCGVAILSSSLTVDWVFNGLELMRIPALVTTITSIVNVIGLYTLVRSPGDVYKYALFAPTLALFNVLGCLGFLVKRNLKLSIPRFATFKRSITASYQLGITVSLVIVLHFANNLIVKYFLGLEALGVFLSAFFIIEIASTLPTIIGTVFLARLTRVSITSDSIVKRDIKVYAQVHMILGFFIAAVCYTEAESIIRLLYGINYIMAVDLLRYMSVAIVFNYAIFSYSNCLISLGYDKVMLLVALVSSVISIAGGLWLVPWLGLKGAAIVIIFIDLGGWIVSLPFYKRISGSFHFDLWVFPVLGAVTIVLISNGIRSYDTPLWIRITLYAIGYVCFIYKDVGNTLRQHRIQ